MRKCKLCVTKNMRHDVGQYCITCGESFSLCNTCDERYCFGEHVLAVGNQKNYKANKEICILTLKYMSFRFIISVCSTIIYLCFHLANANSSSDAVLDCYDGCILHCYINSRHQPELKNNEKAKKQTLETRTSSM